MLCFASAQDRTDPRRIKGYFNANGDRHLQQIAKHGRMAWQTSSGYTKRARAETGMARFKQVIGDGLRSHTDKRRATEVDIAVHVLNRMLELGRPNSVRIV